MKLRNLYIAYGSNLNLDQMAYRCPTAKLVGESSLAGYQLLFRGSKAGAVATIEKLKGGSVPALIWQLEPRDEAALDKYEGYPFLYKKKYVVVNVNGVLKKGMVYIMNEGYPLGAPSRFYLDAIMEGYRTARFDTDILNTAVRASAGK